MSLSPSDQQTPGSCPPWAPIDFSTTPLSCLLQEEEHLVPPPFFSMDSKSASSLPSFNHPQLLSSPASMGASTGKVCKRKSRAATKLPIRILSADRASFRDMVQKLTGIPTSPSLQAGQVWGGGSNPTGGFRPMAARLGLQSDLMAAAAVAAHQSLPTLDTSSAYLSRGFSSNNLVYDEAGNNSRSNSLYDGSTNMRAAAAAAEENFDMSGGVRRLDASRGMVYEEGLMGGGAAYLYEGGSMVAMDMESLQGLRRVSELESLLMGSTHLEDLLQSSNKMEQWYSLDPLHSTIPQVQMAHSA